MADGSRVASSTRRSTTCRSNSCNTQDHGSALEKRGFLMPIIGSVLRSCCCSYHHFLSVRYILPLSDSKSNASFIPIGNIAGLRRHRNYLHLDPPNGFQGLLESVVDDHIRSVVFALGFSQIAIARPSSAYPDHGGPCNGLKS